MVAALEGNSMLCRHLGDLWSRRRIHIRICDLVSLTLSLFSLIYYSSKRPSRLGQEMGVDLRSHHTCNVYSVFHQPIT